MASKKQIRANRLNAQKSTGPKTAEGKARSRQNALKHGILAQSLILEGKEHGESKEQFDSLHQHLIHDLAPVGILEFMQVETIAVCYWRKARALRAESLATDQLQGEADKKRQDAQHWDDIEAIRQGMFARYGTLLPTTEEVEAYDRAHPDDPWVIQKKFWHTDEEHPENTSFPPPPPLPTADPVPPLPPDKQLNALVRYETMLDRQLTRALTLLTQLQSQRTAGQVPRSRRDQETRLRKTPHETKRTHEDTAPPRTPPPAGGSAEDYVDSPATRNLPPSSAYRTPNTAAPAPDPELSKRTDSPVPDITPTPSAPPTPPPPSPLRLDHHH